VVSIFPNVHSNGEGRLDAEVRVAPLDDGRLDYGSGGECPFFDHRCADQPLTIDLLEHDVLAAAVANARVGNGHELLAHDAAADNGGDDPLLAGVDDDILDVAGVGAIGGFQDMRVFADAELGEFRAEDSG